MGYNEISANIPTDNDDYVRDHACIAHSGIWLLHVDFVTVARWLLLLFISISFRLSIAIQLFCVNGDTQ